MSSRRVLVAVDTVYSAPAAAAPRAVASSPSGWATRWSAVGASRIGWGRSSPSRRVRVSRAVTSTSARLRSVRRANAARLPATLRSSSAPPAMKSYVIAGSDSRASASNSSRFSGSTAAGYSRIPDNEVVTRRGWLLFGAMALIWGVPYLLIKIAVAELTPATLVLLRTAVASVILLPIAAARGDLRPLVRHWPWVVAYTFAEVAGPWILLADAERKLSSSLAGLLIAGVPLVGSLLVWLIGGDDRPDARRVFGLVVGFVGVALVVGLDLATDDLLAVRAASPPPFADAGG